MGRILKEQCLSLYPYLEPGSILKVVRSPSYVFLLFSSPPGPRRRLRHVFEKLDGGTVPAGTPYTDSYHPLVSVDGAVSRTPNTRRFGRAKVRVSGPLFPVRSVVCDPPRTGPMGLAGRAVPQTHRSGHDALSSARGGCGIRTATES